MNANDQRSKMKKYLYIIMGAVGLGLIGNSLLGNKIPEGGGHEASWLEDYSAASASAKNKGKPVLINFTGSDWCYYCKKMDAEVLTQKEFVDYSDDSLVLFKADFPRGKEIPETVAAQNRRLAEEYGVRGFPTFVLVKDGKVVGKWVGYVSGGPAGFIKEIKNSL
jgi:protein disulfide-isomerase